MKRVKSLYIDIKVNNNSLPLEGGKKKITHVVNDPFQNNQSLYWKT